MIKAETFVRAAQEAGFTLWTGVPCSYLKPFINFVIDASVENPIQEDLKKVGDDLVAKEGIEAPLEGNGSEGVVRLPIESKGDGGATDVGVTSADTKGHLRPFSSIQSSTLQKLRYIPAVNEGDAVAIAAGATLAGTRAIAMFQNSGLGNAVNPLSSLTYIFKIPILLITTLRGEPGGPHDEPQHELMGSITSRMLEVLQIRWEYFPTEEGEVTTALKRARRHMEETGLPFAFVMRKDSVAPYKLKASAAMKATKKAATSRPEAKSPLWTPNPSKDQTLAGSLHTSGERTKGEEAELSKRQSW
ncbi:MAG: hypothetical protein SNJ78_11635, partial [Spirochaetales bacterium]